MAQWVSSVNEPESSRRIRLKYRPPDDPAKIFPYQDRETGTFAADFTSAEGVLAGQADPLDLINTESAFDITVPTSSGSGDADTFLILSDDTPTAVAAAAAAGVGDQPSRDTHVHNYGFSTDTPASINSSGTVGTDTLPSHSDHAHPGVHSINWNDTDAGTSGTQRLGDVLIVVDDSSYLGTADGGSGIYLTNEGVLSVNADVGAVSGAIVLANGANVSIAQGGTGNRTFTITANAGSNADLSNANPEDVAATANSGNDAEVSRDDHVHKGVLSVARTGALYGAITTTVANGITITQAGQNLEFKIDPTANVTIDAGTTWTFNGTVNVATFQIGGVAIDNIYIRKDELDGKGSIITSTAASTPVDIEIEQDLNTDGDSDDDYKILMVDWDEAAGWKLTGTGGATIADGDVLVFDSGTDHLKYDDPFIEKSLATAAEQMLVSDGADSWTVVQVNNTEMVFYDTDTNGIVASSFFDFLVNYFAASAESGYILRFNAAADDVEQRAQFLPQKHASDAGASEYDVYVRTEGGTEASPGTAFLTWYKDSAPWRIELTKNLATT